MNVPKPIRCSHMLCLDAAVGIDSFWLHQSEKMCAVCRQEQLWILISLKSTCCNSLTFSFPFNFHNIIFPPLSQWMLYGMLKCEQHLCWVRRMMWPWNWGWWKFSHTSCFRKLLIRSEFNEITNIRENSLCMQNLIGIELPIYKFYQTD